MCSIPRPTPHRPAKRGWYIRIRSPPFHQASSSLSSQSPPDPRQASTPTLLHPHPSSSVPKPPERTQEFNTIAFHCSHYPAYPPSPRSLRLRLTPAPAHQENQYIPCPSSLHRLPWSLPSTTARRCLLYALLPVSWKSRRQRINARDRHQLLNPRRTHISRLFGGTRGQSFDPYTAGRRRYKSDIYT